MEFKVHLNQSFIEYALIGSSFIESVLLHWNSFWLAHLFYCFSRLLRIFPLPLSISPCTYICIYVYVVCYLCTCRYIRTCIIHALRLCLSTASNYVFTYVGTYVYTYLDTCMNQCKWLVDRED